MNKVKALILGSVMLGSLVYPTLVANSAMTCLKSGEQISGMNKICYYNCPTGSAAITIKSYQLCPLSIQR